MLGQTFSITKIHLIIGKEPPLKPQAGIPLVAETTALDKQHRSLDACVQQDVTLAWIIPVEDEVMDALYFAAGLP
jgi:hypothetical protein